MSVLKKAFAILITLIYITGCLSGCSSPGTTEARSENLKIVATIFPAYDWVKNILGDKAGNADLTLLLDSGVDLHSYQPTASDILKISVCDMFVYVGGESDKWVDDALKNATNKDMVVINLLETLGDSAKEEELIEGMQESEHHEGHDDEDHDHEDHDHHHEEGEIEYDEHVWLSLRNAGTFVNTISTALRKLDPENASSYKDNAEAYTAKLNALDKEYKAAVDSASVKTLLFGDRFPFRYLVDDYGLDYYAAFVGCSAETEASFETITFLANKVDELSLNSVLTIEKSDCQIAKTIIDNSSSKDRKILTLDSLQSTTGQDVENGATYLSIMESNLSVLKEALK